MTQGWGGWRWWWEGGVGVGVGTNPPVLICTLSKSAIPKTPPKSMTSKYILVISAIFSVASPTMLPGRAPFL